MPIRVVCPSCGRSGRVPDHAAGRTVSCPACGYRYQLAPSSPSLPDGLELLDDPEPERPAPGPARVTKQCSPPPARPAEEDDPYDVPDSPESWGARPPVSRPGVSPAVLAGGGAAAVLVALVLAILLTRRPVGGSGATAGAEPAFIESARAAAAAPVRDDGPVKALSTADIVAESDPSIALIKGKASSGTGFLVGPGLIATNAHVIDDEFVGSLEVHFPSADPAHKGPVVAELLYEDSGRDLAFLAVKTDLKPLRVAGSYTFRKGEDVTVIGSPGIGDGKVLANAVSRGVMSTETELDGKRFYQMGIAVNPGNSGGPVFDSAGRVIGVVTLKTSEQEALAFCVPVEDLRAGMANVGRQSAADSAKVTSRHRVVRAVKGLGLGGAVYCSVIDANREASAGRLDPDERERLNKVEGILSELDAAVFAPIAPEVPAVQADSLLAEVVRSQVGEMADNFNRLKTAYTGRKGGVPGSELREMKQTHRRLVTDLSRALNLEVPAKLLTSFDDREGSPQAPSMAMRGAMPPSMESFRQRIWERHGLRPPSLPTPPGFPAPSFGPRGRIGPRFGPRAGAPF